MFKKRQKEQLLQLVHGNKQKYLKHKWLDQESNLGSL